MQARGPRDGPAQYFDLAAHCDVLWVRRLIDDAIIDALGVGSLSTIRAASSRARLRADSSAHRRSSLNSLLAFHLP